MSRIYNLQRDVEDVRDVLHYGEMYRAAKLPPEYDLRDLCPPVWDQGTQGSCSSHAGCACRVMLEENKDLDLSRAFLYYEERALNGMTHEDSGSTIRDICKATLKYGICPSADMPYNEKDYKTAPTETAVKHAVPFKIPSYKRLLSIDTVKQSLVSRHQPVIIGMTVYESMESDAVEKSGILPMPEPGEKILGGHAVLVVGYKDEKLSFWDRICRFFIGPMPKGYFIVRNSWGESWGQEGYFMMPYEYFSQYAFDYWIMEK